MLYAGLFALTLLIMGLRRRASRKEHGEKLEAAQLRPETAPRFARLPASARRRIR